LRDIIQGNPENISNYDRDGNFRKKYQEYLKSYEISDSSKNKIWESFAQEEAEQ